MGPGNQEVTGRGTGRTRRDLEQAFQFIDKRPGLVFFVLLNSKMDDYCFRLIVDFIRGRDNIETYSMHSRTIVFKNAVRGRMRFINWDDIYLEEVGPDKWRVKGYRPGTPIVWDHAAYDRMIEHKLSVNDRSLEDRRRKLWKDED